MTNSKELLATAVEKGQLQTVKDILERMGGRFNKEKGYKLLCAALKNRHSVVATFLLEKGCGINRNELGESPLHHAVRSGDLTNVKLLLKKGARVNAANGRSDKPLHVAIKSSVAPKVKSQIIKFLVDYNADVNGKGSQLPINIAVENDDEATVQILLDYNVNVNPDKHTPPLFLAAEKGLKNICEMLLKKGANVNNLISYEDKLAMEVTRESSRQMNYDLGKSGAGIFKSRPLHMATINGHIEIVKLLIQYEADLDSTDWVNHSALSLACSNGEMSHMQIVKILLDSGRCDIFSENHGSITNIFLFNKVNQPKRAEILNILARHIIKMLAADLCDTKKKPSLLVGYIRNHYDSDVDMHKYACACEKELDLMKTDKTDEFSIFDILGKSVGKLTHLIHSERIVKAVKNGNFEKRFPIYCGMISRKIGKALEQSLYLDKAESFFEINCSLPILCTSIILDYLTDEDLKALSMA